jgi:thioredoxin 1
MAFRLAIIIVPNKKNNMKIVTDKKSFTEKVLNEQGIQVVKFYADWSGPCQMMAPIYKELSAYYSSSVGFFTVDVEESPMLKAELGVIELPTILFYKNGTVIDFVNGMISKNALIAKLENALNQKN